MIFERLWRGIWIWIPEWYMNVREWFFLHDFSSIAAAVMWSQMEHDQMFIHVINPTLFHRILKIIVYLIDIPPNSTISISKYKLKIPKALKTRTSVYARFEKIKFVDGNRTKKFLHSKNVRNCNFFCIFYNGVNTKLDRVLIPRCSLK